MALCPGIVKQAFAFLHLFEAEGNGATRFIRLYRADFSSKFNRCYTTDRDLKCEEYSRYNKQDESLHSWFSFKNLAHSFWLLNTAPTQSRAHPLYEGASPSIKRSPLACPLGNRQKKTPWRAKETRTGFVGFLPKGITRCW